MIPAKTPQSNVSLVHPEAGDLPAQVLVVYDQAHVGTPPEHLPAGAAQMAVETTWSLDDGERKAIANGAPVTLTVLGTDWRADVPILDQAPRHPPVMLEVGEPDTAGRELLDRGHVARAFGWIFGSIRQTDGPYDYVELTHDAAGEILPGDFKITMAADEFASLCDRAIEATRHNPDADRPSGLHLPSDVRRDL